MLLNKKKENNMASAGRKAPKEHKGDGIKKAQVYVNVRINNSFVIL